MTFQSENVQCVLLSLSLDRVNLYVVFEVFFFSPILYFVLFPLSMDTVTVQANRGYAFLGLFVQARRQATGRDITEALGEFTSVSSGTKFITCVTVAVSTIP